MLKSRLKYPVLLLLAGPVFVTMGHVLILYIKRDNIVLSHSYPIFTVEGILIALAVFVGIFSYRGSEVARNIGLVFGALVFLYGFRTSVNHLTSSYAMLNMMKPQSIMGIYVEPSDVKTFSAFLNLATMIYGALILSLFMWATQPETEPDPAVD